MGTRTVSVVPPLAAAADDSITVEVVGEESLPDHLWGPPARAAALGTTISGGALIALSWFGASGTRVVSHQLPWLIGSIAGLGVAALGEGLWLLSGRRSLGRGFVAVLPAPASRAGEAATAAECRPAGRADGDLVAIDGRAGLYHRPACVFAAGKPTVSAERAAHERAGRTPCEVCQP